MSLKRVLYSHQVGWRQDIRGAYGAGYRSVMGVLPTGGGKTPTICSMAADAAAKGTRVAILAHRIEIIDQISEELRLWGVEHGFIAPGRGFNPFALVTVCSVMALARRIRKGNFRPYQFIIIDEAHHATAGSSWGQIIAAHPSAKILGVTATPQRLSGEPLDAFETMVIGPSTAELIQMGRLSPYKIYAPPTVDMSAVHKRAGDYARAENEALMDKPTITGNAVREYMRRTPGKRAIAFCVSVAHAQHVAAQFETNGVRSESIDGTMDRMERRNLMARFRTGQTKVLTAADIVSEGTDVPAVEVAILLRPTQSLSMYLQQVGRALRVFSGKEYAVILDHAGNVMRHGLPDDDREWTLEGRVKGRGSDGEKTIPMSQCNQCFFTGRPFVICPSCGHERKVEGRKIEEVEGELTEIDLEAARTAKRVEQARAKTFEELVELAVNREYKKPEGWVAIMMKQRGLIPNDPSRPTHAEWRVINKEVDRARWKKLLIKRGEWA